TSDTDLLALRSAAAELPSDFGVIDARNPARLDQEQIDRLAAEIARGACWAVCLRLLGGRRAFPDGFDRIRRACLDSSTPFLAWPGEQGQDLELEAASTASGTLVSLGRRYLVEGGIENTRALLRSL